MGLDIYAGPVTRYVAGDWLTAVQQALAGRGTRVEIVRQGEPDEVVRELQVAIEVVEAWKAGLASALRLAATWEESTTGPYATDKPDWAGYGAVLLLAAYDERPDLAPGATVRKRLRTATIEAVPPRRFPKAPAYDAARRAPVRYPTLLHGAEWCLPVNDGPDVFEAATPNGTMLTMGRVDCLLTELRELNDRALRLSSDQLAAARTEGPPGPDAPVEDMAPFGLAVLMGLAEFAAANAVPWIMDY